MSGGRRTAVIGGLAGVAAVRSADFCESAAAGSAELKLGGFLGGVGAGD